MLSEERCILNKLTRAIRGTVYTKWVYIVPLTAVYVDFSFQLEKTYSCYKRNGVYKMCIHRSSYCSICRFSLELEKLTRVIRETVHTKFVYIVPLNAVAVDFSFHLKKVTRVMIGMVYTKCVYMAPLTAVDVDFSLNLKKLTRVTRETVYTKCVYILPLAGVDIDFSFELEKTYSCYKRNGVHKMCIHRSYYCSSYRFFP